MYFLFECRGDRQLLADLSGVYGHFEIPMLNFIGHQSFAVIYS